MDFGCLVRFWTVLCAASVFVEGTMCHLTSLRQRLHLTACQCGARTNEGRTAKPYTGTALMCQQVGLGYRNKCCWQQAAPQS